MKKEYVWYSPEWDVLHVAKKNEGNLFESTDGLFHICYRLCADNYYRMEYAEFFLIGEL